MMKEAHAGPRAPRAEHDLEFNSAHDRIGSPDHCGHHLCIWRCRLIGPSKRPSAPKIGLRLIFLGLVGICLFYFADLLSMHVLPVVMSMQAATAFMDTLHQNVSWLVVLFAMIAISSGFIELRRTQIELAEKNELLADLSSKLAKFLPAQLYNSIFTGTQSIAVTAKRKKLTVFFSDIANFTETADSLESEELTNLLNQYLTEMSRIARESPRSFCSRCGAPLLYERKCSPHMINIPRALLLRRNRRAPQRCIHASEALVQSLERRIRHCADRPQRMILGHSPLRRNIAEHRRLFVIRPAHPHFPHQHE